MNQIRSTSQKRAEMHQSVKALIAAAAVAATLGGWAVLSASDGGASTAAAAPAPIQTAPLTGQNPSAGLGTGGGQAPSSGQVPSFGGRRRGGQGFLNPFGGTAPSAQAPNTQDPNAGAPLPFTRTRSSR